MSRKITRRDKTHVRTKQIELVSLLTSGYRGDMLKAIDACVRSINTPINVRCLKFGAATANEAYYDMMRRTRRNFLDAPIMDSFTPCDKASGQAKLWINEGLRLIRLGGGGFPLRMWNGQHHVDAKTDCITIGGWLVTVFKPHEPLSIVRSHENQVCRPLDTTQRIIQPPTLRPVQ